jgi:phosphoribosylanthranilate isomerase
MENSCKIKLGSVNNLTDARFGAAAGTEWIGFRFDESHPLHISPVQAEAIIGWLEGPKAVAEFSPHHNLNEIEDIIRLLGFEWIQLANTDMLHFFEGSDVKVILEVDIEKGGVDSLKNSSDAIGCFLAKNYKIEDVEVLKANAQNILFDVEGLTKSELEQLKGSSPYGINISGGFETAPGLRDFDEMSEVFELFGEY